MGKTKTKTKFFRVNSIKVKLIVIFSILILFESVAIGYISLKSSNKAIVNKTEDALISLSRESAKLTKSRIDSHMKTLETIASFSGIRSMDWSVQQPILQEQVERTGFLDLAIVNLDGIAHYSGGNTADLGDRDYIIKALRGESAVSDLIISRVTNGVVLMYATPIYKDGEIVAALICRNDGNFLTELIEDIGYGEKGYGFMIDSSGTIVAHPNKDYVLEQFNPLDAEDDQIESLANLVREILEVKEGATEYNYDGMDLYSGYTPIEGTNWFFVTTADKDEILADIPVLHTNIMRMSGLVLIGCIVFVFFFGSILTAAILKGITHTKKIASLDISQDVPAKYLKRKDEIGDIARALQDITVNLRGMIKNIIASSDHLSASSQELSSISQEAAATSEEVSKSSESIANSAHFQSKRVEIGVEKASVLGDTIENAQDDMRQLNESTERVMKVVIDGLEDIEELADITKECNEAVRVIHDVILKTNESSRKIAKASQLIAMIARETNLLAINAAIEASRASDSGKTFSVVADRIRNLAEQSSDSIGIINDVVKELQVNSENSVKIIERIVKITEEQTDKVKESKDEYLLISEATGSAVKAVNHITESGQRIVAMKDEILDILQSISAIAEENSAATQEVSSAMLQQASSVEEVASSSESLSHLAQELQRIVSEFKV